MKKHHMYQIQDPDGRIVKTGISGGRINKKGISFRGGAQARKYGKGYEAVTVRKNINGRQRALLYEQANVNRLNKKGNLYWAAGKHKRPMPKYKR
ncbi:hypothetical protein [Shouchella hunanensis]|uniref:Tox-URI2 domain-containing protein n=1 Tax=Shouchella hunanensis TaxID=766894 RepID=A0ABY7W1E2_9BACI|nr:hypothetical protein [Shouchella hunanensis]WDF02376.1 hypothetical protein PQ477_12675 [Shouchella hunanensis]